MNYLIYVCTLILHRILLLVRVCKRMRHMPLRPATFSKCIKYPLIQANTKIFYVRLKRCVWHGLCSNSLSHASADAR